MARSARHPVLLGPLTLDCDVPSVAGGDLHLMVRTAEPGTRDAERLTLVGVLGTRALLEHSGRAGGGR